METSPPTEAQKRIGALSCLRMQSRLPRDVHQRIVWKNFADVFPSLLDMLEYARGVREKRRGIHALTERAIVRDYRDGYSVLAISKDRGVDIDVVEEIIDRRVRHGR